MMEARDIATWVYLGPERRQGERKVFRGSAQLLLPNRELVQVRTIDISPGGLGLVAPSNLSPAMVCEIRFRAPLQGERLEILQARGRIAYSVLSGKENGFLVGFQFTDIPTPALTLIKRYVGPAT
jgi:c-di-GMP-binding flagellar brake protein YcgR